MNFSFFNADNLNGVRPFHNLANDDSGPFMTSWVSRHGFPSDPTYERLEYGRVSLCANPLKLRAKPCVAADSVSQMVGWRAIQGRPYPASSCFEGEFEEAIDGKWLFLPYKDNQCTYIVLPDTTQSTVRYVATSQMSGCSFFIMENDVTDQKMAVHCNANQLGANLFFDKVKSAQLDDEINANVVWKTCMANSILQMLISPKISVDNDAREWRITQSLHR